MYSNMRKSATAIGVIGLTLATFLSPASATDLLGSTGDRHIDDQRRAELRWSGFYAGIGGVMGMTVTDTTGKYYGPEKDGVRPILGQAGLDGLGGEGFGITGMLGYDQRVGRWVLGVYGDFTYTDDFWETSWSYGLGDNRISGEFNRKYDWSAGVRVGKLINPGTMIYLLGGYTQMTAEFPSGLIDSSSPKPLGTGDKTFNGYTIGVGLESKANDFLGWYVEGRWSKYDSESVTFGDAEDPKKGLVTIEAEPSEVRVMGGLRLRLLTE